MWLWRGGGGTARSPEGQVRGTGAPDILLRVGKQRPVLSGLESAHRTPGVTGGRAGVGRGAYRRHEERWALERFRPQARNRDRD